MEQRGFGEIDMDESVVGARPTGAPSNALLHAAVSGLLGFGAAACGDDTTEAEEDPDQRDGGGMCEPMECECNDSGDGDGDGELVEEEDKEISVEDVQHTFAELKQMCDERDGYVEIHGSCSGVNTCQGFFYGDWGEDAQLVEHTCSGVNGCAGLSCLVPEGDSGEEPMTGLEIMQLDEDWFIERAGQYGPKPCKTCHIQSEFDEALETYVYDYEKLRLPVWPDAGRDASNWLDRPAVQQEQLVAFGAQGVTAEGVRYSNMVSYAKLFSKAEIQAVVEFMRGFDPEDISFEDIKIQPGEPEPMGTPMDSGVPDEDSGTAEE